MRVKRVSRRSFLRGTAGVTIALPFLSSFGEPARAAGGAPPKRAVTWYTPNGFDPEGRPRTVDLSGTSMEPLAPFRSQVTTIQGMEQSSRLLDPSPSDGAHYQGWSHCVVGDDCWPGSDAGRVAGSISYDQRIAQDLCGDTPFRSLNQGGPSWYGGNEPASSAELYSPRAIFDTMFAGLDADPAALDAARTRRRSVLDFALGSVSQLRCRLPSEDRARLDQHLESVRDLERRIDASPVAACAMPAVPPEYAWEDYRDRSRELWDEWADIKVDLLARAFACDITRVGTIGFGGPANGTTPVIMGPDADHHELSHRTDPEARAMIRDIERWYAGKLATLLDRLQATPADESTSVLDHTAVLWVTEGGGRDGHGHTDQFYVVAGGAIRGGQHLDLTGTPHNDLLLTLIDATVPVPLESFGNPDVCNGVIPELV